MKGKGTEKKCGDIDDNQKELIPHGTIEFPCAGYQYQYTEETELFIPWHWHEEFEINYVKEGALKLQIPYQEFFMRTGDLAVLNGNILHYAEASPYCELQSLVFSPLLLTGSAASAFSVKYLKPLSSCGAFGGLFIPAEDREAGEWFRKAFSALRSEEFGYEFIVREQLSKMMLKIFKRMEEQILLPETSKNMDTFRMEQMLAFIHDHYEENILLTDIAAVSGIGERECLRCFKRTIGESPVQYLLKYRLMQSAGLLLSRTSDSISDIASACGFDYPSYYARQFKRFYQCTPKEYRKKRNLF